MSKTDKTRPWWVKMAEAPMVHCRPVHDHRDGVCTLPGRVDRESASLNRRMSGCYWQATDTFLFGEGALSGGREWTGYCREARRRERRAARRELRDHRADD
ncbi:MULTISPECIES: hypothetical protein [Nonomuraea]|jgi:hypothetical protein|uniref:Uncharacterized protein n=1 Tax=Nonomuraea salmonea TaxID=46181 RepID=A0ABV5NTR1_9ACTN